MGARLVLLFFVTAVVGGSIVMSAGTTYVTADQRYLVGALTMSSAMVLGAPLRNLIMLRRWPYRAAPTVVELSSDTSVPALAEAWLARAKSPLEAAGFELLAKLRVDRGSFNFVHLYEHAQDKTVAMVSWHGRARSLLYETRVNGRRRVTSSSDSMVDLPDPEEVDHVRLAGLEPSELLVVHRARLAESGEGEETEVRVDPLGWLRTREKRGVEALVAHGLAVVDGDAMHFTWRGAERAVLPTSWPARGLLLVARTYRARLYVRTASG